jgi:hypothetical protein
MKKSISQNRIALLFAWILMLFASILPDVILKEIFNTQPPVWLFWTKIGLLIMFFLLSWLFPSLRKIRKFMLLLAVLLLLEYASAFVQNAIWWKRLFTGTAFVRSLANQQILRVLTALIMAGILWLIFKKFSAFYLVKGDLKAEAAPIPLLMSRPTRWNKLGWILAACISGGTLLFLAIGAGPQLANLAKVVPLVPFVLLFALMNSLAKDELPRRLSIRT